MPVLEPSIRPALFAYLATVARNTGCECYCVGGVADHLHLAIRLSRTITIPKVVEELKTSSSKWLKTQSPALAAFSWQRGYGAFSVKPSDLDVLRNYIDNQESHHRKRTFQNEYRAFLTKYRVEYDEQYLWDWTIGRFVLTGLNALTQPSGFTLACSDYREINRCSLIPLRYRWSSRRSLRVTPLLRPILGPTHGISATSWSE